MAATTTAAATTAPAQPTAELAASTANVGASSPTAVRTAQAQMHSSPSVRIATPKAADVSAATSSNYPIRKLVRRDSLERREALLKGKEGSRQRRRWENDRLLSNPWAEPPLPSDWEVRPTYPRRTVPYYLAPLWDAAEFQRAVEAKLRGRKGSMRVGGRRTAASGGPNSLRYPGMSPMEEAAASVPKEVKARLKKSRAAKGLLMDLEESVRGFVRVWNEREMKRARGESASDDDDEQEQDTGMPSSGASRQRSETLDTEESAVLVSEDEGDEDDEIVFVGRNGTMLDMPLRLKQSSANSAQADAHTLPGTTASSKAAQRDHTDLQATLAREKLVFEGSADDKGASFARWLVHCVGSYYGLRTWSVTREVAGSADRREAYVGIDERATGLLGRAVNVGDGDGPREVELPRPLWGLV